MQIWLVYTYLLNVPSVSTRHFNKLKTNVSFREILRLIARNSFKLDAVKHGIQLDRRLGHKLGHLILFSIKKLEKVVASKNMISQ